MVEVTSEASGSEATGTDQDRDSIFGHRSYTYDRWMRSINIPVHTGYFIPDLRTVELGWWKSENASRRSFNWKGSKELLRPELAKSNRAKPCLL